MGLWGESPGNDCTVGNQANYHRQTAFSLHTHYLLFFPSVMSNFSFLYLFVWCRPWISWIKPGCFMECMQFFSQQSSGRGARRSTLLFCKFCMFQDENIMQFCKTMHPQKHIITTPRGALREKPFACGGLQSLYSGQLDD